MEEEKSFIQNEIVLGQENVIGKQMSGDFSELRNLEDELQVLKVAEELVFDDEESVRFHIEELTKQVELKRVRVEEMKSDRCEEVEVEMKPVLAEIERRKEEISKLISDLEKQPKMAPRKSHIERINEITKNSRKQDADIQRILKDTREVQLESNTIQERLNRTYAVVDETIFREAKKDPVARQAYRLLAKMHESFEQIAEKILATDRSRRDAADYEAKLAAMSSRNLNLEKLKMDLDAIRKENELLGQQLGNV